MGHGRRLLTILASGESDNNHTHQTLDGKVGQDVVDKLDYRIFLRVPHDVLKQRRHDRHGYHTAGRNALSPHCSTPCPNALPPTPCPRKPALMSALSPPAEMRT